MTHALTSAKVAPKKQEPKQKTRPKRGKPAEIPIPTRDRVLRDLAEVAKPDKDPDFGPRLEK